MNKLFRTFPVVLIFLVACGAKGKQDVILPGETPAAELLCEPAPLPEKSRMGLYLDSLGMIDVGKTDSTIVVQLMYATADNFTGHQLYDDLQEAYLHPDAARAILQAQQVLRQQHPDYRLIIYDAARPMSVQQKMWDVVKGTSKYKYVSNPARGGGLHNYGLAVDISIIDSSGTPLDMGTPIDYLGDAAGITQETVLVQSGQISEAARQNRCLLRNVMKEAGFRALPGEWWHFNLYSRDYAKQHYQPIP